VSFTQKFDDLRLVGVHANRLITVSGSAQAGGSERSDTAGDGEFGVVVGEITKVVRTVFLGKGYPSVGVYTLTPGSVKEGT